VFVGLAFRDHLSYTRPRASEPVWPNRATLLEQAWERRYAAIVGTGRIGRSGFEPSSRLAKRFGYVAETLGEPPKRKGWLPLLFVNGSSVMTGRRILTTDVKP